MGEFIRMGRSSMRDFFERTWKTAGVKLLSMKASSYVERGVDGAYRRSLAKSMKVIGSRGSTQASDSKYSGKRAKHSNFKML